jgi:hypothetical protein
VGDWDAGAAMSKGDGKMARMNVLTRLGFGVILAVNQDNK